MGDVLRYFGYLDFEDFFDYTPKLEIDKFSRITLLVSAYRRLVSMINS